MAPRWLADLESRAGDDPAGVAAALAYAAASEIPLDPAVVRGATRRAVFVLAAGGDPHRALGFDDPAVETLAADLATPERTDALGSRLAEVASEADGLPGVGAVLTELRSDSHLAWCALACALLLEEVEGDD